MRVVQRLAAVLAALALAATAGAQGKPDAPYVPTPQKVVDAMLDLGKVGPGDYVIDLGSGDGRIVLTAAQRGARGLGVEIDERLVAQANDSARARGVADRATFSRENLFETDLSRATVVTTYLLPEMNIRLRPKFLALAPGTRIVAHDYHLGDWIPDERETLDVPEKKTGNIGMAYVYLWVVPAKVAGRWAGEVPLGGRLVPVEVELDQQFQRVSGRVRGGSDASPILAPSLRGEQVAFGFDLRSPRAAARYGFKGVVTGDRIEGTLSWRDGGEWRERLLVLRRAGA
ncbi:MAG: SAM-dependent methyltransferase [Burkholderiales bacterium]|nr:SAM-dependent methyltransferase [Burkholderiales bacterium]